MISMGRPPSPNTELGMDTLSSSDPSSNTTDPSIDAVKIDWWFVDQPASQPSDDQLNIMRTTKYLIFAIPVAMIFAAYGYIFLLPSTISEQHNLHSCEIAKYSIDSNHDDVILLKLFDPLISSETKSDDQILVYFVRKYFMHPPSSRMYKIIGKVFETKQASAVLDIKRRKKGGFFIECGALDGLTSSNTIVLEKDYNWNGLLVEMDPSWFKQLSGRNRKAYSINACLSMHPYPEKVNFFEHPQQQGALDKKQTKKSRKSEDEVYCFPLYTMLLALNRTHVDYFSLDVEGLEMDVLKTIPWSKITIDIISVEFKHGKETKESYIEYMSSIGYKLHSEIHARYDTIKYYAEDYVFIRNDAM